MAKETPKVAPPPLLIIKGTGPEPEPPPYRYIKPGIPPGAAPDETQEMAKDIPNVEPPPLLIIRGTGPEPEPPPYHTNKPGVPPGANPPGLKTVRSRRARRNGGARNGRAT